MIKLKSKGRHSIKLASTLISCLFLLSSVYGMGEPPSFENPPPDPADQVKKDQNSNNENGQSVVAEEVPSENEVTISKDELYELEQEYQSHIKTKQFDKALMSIEKIPTNSRSKEIETNFSGLKLFKKIDDDLAAESGDFFKVDDLEDDVKKSVKRLYREAQLAYLNDEFDLARDLAIQILHFHRRNYKAKKLLEEGLELRPGSYKVENMEAKYWNQSSVLFYGGTYAKAVEALNVLTFFNKEDAKIYERLGSSYYMMGEKSKAVGAWNTALFLDPKNKDLPSVIAKTQKLIEDDAAKARAEAAKKTTKKKPKVKVPTQLMGVFPSQTKAYNFAANLKKQGLVPIVEEMDNGKWSVSIPKKKGK